MLPGIAQNGVRLVAIGYRYSVKTTLFFVMTENSGSTKSWEPYMMKYMDMETCAQERWNDLLLFLASSKIPIQ